MDAVLPKEIIPGAISFKGIKVLCYQCLEFIKERIQALVERGYAEFLADSDPNIALTRHCNSE